MTDKKRTSGGVELTDELLDRLAEEAEKGYKVENLRRNETKRKVWLVDVDGTVALRVPGGRGPFDWARVSEDVPNEPVIRVVRSLITTGETVLFMSGRNEVCFADTGRWIDDHVFAGLDCGASYAGLLMRPDTKEWRYRFDDELKAWLYDTKVAPFYEVVGVLDDRDKVVKMWRSKGLTCLQVAEGNF